MNVKNTIRYTSTLDMMAMYKYNGHIKVREGRVLILIASAKMLKSVQHSR